MEKKEHETIREKIVLNKFDYPKSVIKQATEENTQVGIHALQLFNMMYELRIKTAMESCWPDLLDKEKPWHKDFTLFTGEEMNNVIGNCFELAENIRTGCDIDLQARLEQLRDVVQKKGKSIIIPTANMVKDSTQRGEVPGLHDQ